MSETDGPAAGGELRTAGDAQAGGAAVETDPAIAAVPRPRHFASFDGLRAIAAVSILLLHTAFISGFTLQSSFGNYTSRLEIGVSVFFLISGFLLYRPFAVSHLAGRQAPNTRRFWERRLLRIVPAYWLALTLLTYVFHLVSLGSGVGEVAIHYLFLQIYFPKAVFFGIPQAWSICTEMSFYLVLPFIAAAVGYRRKSQERQLVRELIGLAVLFLVSLIFRWWSSHLPLLKAVDGHLVGICYPNCGTQSPFPALMVDWLPARLDLFAFGMLLAVLSAWWTERDSEPRWLSSRWMPWLSWIGAAFVFWCVSHLGIPRTPLYITTPVKGIVLQELYGLFAFLLLMPAVFGPQDRSLVRRFLQFWPVASLGVISYGIYLWHLDLIYKFLSWTGYKEEAVPYWILASGVLAMTVVAASISYFCLERPVLKLKDHLSWWGRSSRSVSKEDVEILTK